MRKKLYSWLLAGLGGAGLSFAVTLSGCVHPQTEKPLHTHLDNHPVVMAEPLSQTQPCGLGRPATYASFLAGF